MAKAELIGELHSIRNVFNSQPITNWTMLKYKSELQVLATRPDVFWAIEFMLSCKIYFAQAATILSNFPAKEKNPKLNSVWALYFTEKESLPIFGGLTTELAKLEMEAAVNGKDSIRAQAGQIYTSSNLLIRVMQLENRIPTQKEIDAYVVMNKKFEGLVTQLPENAFFFGLPTDTDLDFFAKELTPLEERKFLDARFFYERLVFEKIKGVRIYKIRESCHVYTKAGLFYVVTYLCNF